MSLPLSPRTVYRRPGSYAYNRKEKMIASLNPLLNELLPLLRQFSLGEYGIALGGAHAKGADDGESDVDLYVFAREVIPGEKRIQLCNQFAKGIESVVSWGDDSEFVQGGTDFSFKGRRVECWLRNSDYVSSIVAECTEGVVRHDLVTWTVMGFYNHCTLSDLAHMIPLDDPCGMLVRWKSDVSQYPPRLRETIIAKHLNAARFWPGNFHYESAVERCDFVYVMGIVQQVVHNLIQVVFALNQAYFPGDKKLEAAIEHLRVKPDRFTERIRYLLYPGVEPDRALFRKQSKELGDLLREVESLTAAHHNSDSDVR